MRQVGEFLEYSANRLGWRGRAKQMTLAGARMSGADPIGAKMHHPRSPEGRAEGMKFALFQVTQLEPVGLWELQRVACPRLVGIEPGAPDNHVVGFGRRILVQFGKAAVWR